MKSFILAINKYKKWIMLSIFIVCTILVLVCPTVKIEQYDGSYKTQIFAVSLFRLMDTYADGIKMNLSPISLSLYQLRFSMTFLCFLSLCAFIVTGILSIVFTFRKKKFSLSWSLLCCLLVRFFYMIKANEINEKIKIHFVFYNTAIIFLILLILDIVYLCLERKYLKENKQEPEEVVKTF